MAKKKKKITHEQYLAMKRKENRRYKEQREHLVGYGEKEIFKAFIYKLVRKTPEELSRIPKARRRTIFRWNFMPRGILEIPISECLDNQSMCEYVAVSHLGGGGLWDIRGGHPHKHANRVVWRGMLRFECIETINYLKVKVVKIWSANLSHYFFRKRDFIRDFDGGGKLDPELEEIGRRHPYYYQPPYQDW